jgi:hypothetical protein
VSLGSGAEVQERRLIVRRLEDRAAESAGTGAPLRVYEITAAPAGPMQMVLDAEGWPKQIEGSMFGGMLRLTRRRDSGA